MGIMSSSYEDCFPHGKTDVTSSDYRRMINESQALDSMRNLGINDPESSLEVFIQEIPDLFSWFENNARDYPWRRTTDPWEAYTAEILLQRTRADNVERVYNTFLERYPSPEALKAANEDEIKQLIGELGLVNIRTKTLVDVGQIFTEEYAGAVPEQLEGLKKPWRVGDYVARATQIFARGKPMGLVDPNICRVISTIMDIELPEQPHKCDKVYNLMDALTPKEPTVSRAFYLALIDRGATL